MAAPDGTGAGLKTVLVHGFGTSARLWRRVLEGAPDALAVDLMGFGAAAPQGRAGQTAEDMADALGRELLASGRRARLVAHSMGGKVALLTAARHPAQVEELLLVAPSPPTPEPMDDEARAALRAAHGDRAALERQYRDITRRPIPEQDFEHLVQDGLRASRAAWAAWPDVGSREDASGEVAGLTLPITVLYSGEDPSIKPETVEAEVLGRFAQARGRRIAGSGHLIPLEDPQAVLDALRP